MVYGFLLLGLAGFALQLPSRAGTVIVIADRSASMPGDSEGSQKDTIDLLPNQIATIIDERAHRFVVAVGNVPDAKATRRKARGSHTLVERADAHAERRLTGTW